MSDNYLRKLSQLRKKDQASAGAKASLLGELFAAGVSVPDGYCLLAEGAKFFEKENKLPPEIETALSSFLKDTPIAVRSSSLVEDSAAFAGIFETILGARGMEEVLSSIKSVLASARSSRAMAAYQEAQLAPQGMAVLLQPLLQADIAGVLLTKDLQEKDFLRIETIPGLGVNLVSGKMTPELILCHRETLACTHKNQLTNHTLLDEKKIKTLSELAKQTEQILGKEQSWELEWVFDKNGVHLLQARLAQSSTHTQQFFGWDQEHNPAPLSEAQAAMVRQLSTRGKVPFRSRVIDGYLFVGPRPYAQWEYPKLSPEFAEQFEEEISAKLMEPILETPETLDEAIEQYLLFCEGYFSGVLSGPKQVLDELHEFLQERELLPGLPKYPDTLPTSDPLAHLMAGTRTRSFQKEASLYAIANLLRNNQEAKELFFSRQIKDIKNSQNASLQRAIEILQEFLSIYGDESFGWDVCLPTLQESPDPVYQIIQKFIDTPSPSPEQRRRQASKKSAKLARIFSEALPEEDKASYFDKLTFARQLFPLTEEDDLIFSHAQGFLRRAFLKKAKEIKLANEEDIFWVEPSDLLKGISNDKIQEKAKQKKTLYQERLKRPPFSVSTSSENNETFQGNSASLGIAKGSARVIRDLGTASLSAGEILVVPALLPSLAHLLLFASGLVAEYGGTLSHAAALAREYGIPAVVGVKGATQLFQNGEQLIVDGTTGTVRREKPE